MTDCGRYSHEAVELELYLMNDYGAHRGYLLPCLRNLAKHHDRGNFRREAGLRSLSRVVNQAARQYNLEHGSMSTPWHEVFPKGDRDRVCEVVLDYFLAELRVGNRFWE